MPGCDTLNKSAATLWFCWSFEALEHLKPSDNCLVGKAPENREKNRYRDILPCKSGVFCCFPFMNLEFSLSLFVQTPLIHFMFTCLSVLLVTLSCKVIELEFIGVSVSSLLWCLLQAHWKVFSEDRWDIWSQLLYSACASSHFWFEQFTFVSVIFP